MNSNMTSTDLNTDYSTWTPDRLMENYNQEPKAHLLVRLGEYYKNREVEAKVNSQRKKDIKNPNFFIALRRGYEIIASRDGHLPTEWRLAYDKRKVENLAKRFGESDRAVSMLRKSIREREARKDVVLPAEPTPKELDAARPERGHDVGFAYETRDYWIKLVAACEKYPEEEMAEAFGMGRSVFHEELRKGNRLVRRFAELDDLESRGVQVPQTYTPPPPLDDGANIFVLSDTYDARRNLSVSTNLKPQTKKRDLDSAIGCSSSPASTPSTGTWRVRRVIYRLRDRLSMSPHNLPPLSKIADSLDFTDITLDHQAKKPRLARDSYETKATLAMFRAFCARVPTVEEYGVERVANCIVWAADKWLDEALDLKDKGDTVGHTFLEALIFRLENFKKTEEIIEDGSTRLDRLAAAIFPGGDEYWGSFTTTFRPK